VKEKKIEKMFWTIWEYPKFCEGKKKIEKCFRPFWEYPKFCEGKQKK